MTDADRISRFADVPQPLAELVATAAALSGVAVSVLRGPSKAEHLVRCRRWIVKRARPRFSFWQIGRALNRDHSTIVHHERIVRLGIEPKPSGRQPVVQLELLS